MIQFKQITFLRLKRQSKNTSQNSETSASKNKYEQLRVALKQLLNWSIHIERHEMKQTFMNYENMAIYNNGIIIHFLDNNRYGVELVTTVPIELCISTQGTLFKQNKNFINYSYEKFVFYSNPTNFFESIGYKIQNQFENKDLQYFRSHTFGVEVVLYPKQGYLQIIESYYSKPEVDNLSTANQIIRSLMPYFDENAEVILSSGNMRPQNFSQQYN